MNNDSEFTCEVVKIDSIQKHPNADRLEVAKFSWADGIVPEYQVVVGKGDFKVGDSAVYISDDSMVPVLRQEFSFLRKRLDYKTGELLYRVRAAKIRGVLSTGMLIENTVFARPGDDVSQTYGVIKYVSPLDQEVAQTELSNTIGLSFTRRVGNQLKKWFRNLVYGQKVTAPDFSVTSLRKVPSLFQDGEMVYVTEKIHGSNIRFGKVRGRWFVGSHHAIKSDNRSALARVLFPHRSRSSWYGPDIYSAWVSNQNIGEFPEGIIFYGEIFGPKIQKMTYGRDSVAVRVFAAWNLKEKRFLDINEFHDALPASLDMPPVLYTGLYNSDLKKLADGNTQLMESNPHLREGVVVASFDGTKRGKFVSEAYLTSNER